MSQFNVLNAATSVYYSHRAINISCCDLLQCNHIFRTFFPRCIQAHSSQNSDPTLNTTECGRMQNTECRVWERGIARARRCLSRTWARPQACTCFDQVLWKFNYLLMKISIVFLKSITFIKEKFSQTPCGKY